MNLQLILAAVALITSGISVGLLRRFFVGLLMDVPNERSSHTRPTPRGGGLGFIVAFAVTMGVAQRLAPDLIGSTITLQTWLALVPLALIGVIDDWRNLPSAVRYLVQLGTAWHLVSVYGAFPFPWIEQIGPHGATLAFGISVICFTALINFYNFMDGLDGLVAGVSSVQLAFLALWCQQPVLWLWVAALIGFLFWNWAPAKIFMGDAGSTILGAVVATSLLTQPNGFEQSWASVAILLPLIGDAIYTLARRLSRGENIFQAHRTHIYQRLHQADWPHGQVAGLYIGATLAIALGLWQFGPLAAWVSLGATLMALALGELYVTFSSKVSTYIAPRFAGED